MSKPEHISTILERTAFARHVCTVQQAARILGVSISMVRKWIADGTLPLLYEHPGRRGLKLLKRADVDSLCQQRIKTQQSAER